MADTNARADGDAGGARQGRNDGHFDGNGADVGVIRVAASGHGGAQVAVPRSRPPGVDCAESGDTGAALRRCRAAPYCRPVVPLHAVAAAPVTDAVVRHYL